MNITVVFPKPCCYDGKGLETKRIYRLQIMKYLNMAKDAGCKFEYFLEDKLARDFLREACITDAKIVTCLSKSDITFFKSYASLVDLEDYVYSEFDSTENYAGDVEKKYTVPLTMLREDRDAYIAKRVETFRKRLRTATDAYILSKKSVLMYRTDNGSDRTDPIRGTVNVGDGRLCIEVNIFSNMAVSYYGGTFIQEEYLPMILSM